MDHRTIPFSLTRHTGRFPLLWLGVAVSLVTSSLWGCHTPTLVRSAPESTERPFFNALGSQDHCLPDFESVEDWYGGDAAYSVALPNREETLWLFGDSFVRRGPTSAGRQFPFIHNSVAISACSPEGTAFTTGAGPVTGGPTIAGGPSLTAHWNRTNPAEPRAFFTPDPNASWVREAHERTGQMPYYWLFGAFAENDTLFVGLLRVGHADPRGPFRLPFELLGMDLARIDRFRSPPEEWRPQISTLSNHRGAFPGSAFVVGEDFLYAFAFAPNPKGHSPRFLTRLPLEKLAGYSPDLESELETLDADGRWQKGVHPAGARILMPDDATEMSVHYDPTLGQWIAVYASPTAPAPAAPGNQAGAPTYIQMRRSDRLEGPWSPPINLLAIPETLPDLDGNFDENLFCYAAKAHPQFSGAGQLLITYVCNLFARSEEETPTILERLRRETHLYRPKFIAIPIPRNP